MVRFSVSIGTLCMWIVPHVAIEIAGFREFTAQSEWWTWRKEEGKLAVTKTAAITIVFWILCYIITCVGVALSTKDMDSRADAIVIGTGNLISAVVISMLSFQMSEWLGVYHPDSPNILLRKRKDKTITFDDLQIPITVRKLRFDLILNTSRNFIQVFLLVMLQFCSVEPGTVALSASVGIVAGLLIYYGIYLGRSPYEMHKSKVAILLSSGLSVAASSAWSYGCYYIQVVWDQDTGFTEAAVIASMFFAWLFVCIVLNVCAWRYTKRVAQHQQAEDQNEDEQHQQQKGDGCQTQMVDAANPDQAIKPPSSLELEPEPETKLEEQSLDVGVAVENAECDDKELPVQSVPEDGALNEEEDETKDVEENSKTPGLGTTKETLLEEHMVEGGAQSEEEEVTKDIEENSTTPEPSVKKEDPLKERMMYVEEKDRNETVCRLVLAKCRCSCCCGSASISMKKEPFVFLGRIMWFFKWLIVIVVNVFCLYFTIVNIGATSEMEVVNHHLPNATRALYPPDYQNGTMCAWDEPTSNGEIKTFDTLQDVYDANCPYPIIITYWASFYQSLYAYTLL